MGNMRHFLPKDTPFTAAHIRTPCFLVVRARREWHGQEIDRPAEQGTELRLSVQFCRLLGRAPTRPFWVSPERSGVFWVSSGSLWLWDRGSKEPESQAIWSGQKIMASNLLPNNPKRVTTSSGKQFSHLGIRHHYLTRGRKRVMRLEI